MNTSIRFFRHPAVLAIAMVLATATWTRAEVPSADSIVSGVRVRFTRPKQNPSAAQLGYGDRDLITKIDGKAIQATYEIRNLEWSPSLRRSVSLTVATTEGKEVQRPAPDSWDGLYLQGESLGWRRYAQYYRSDHGAAWDELVKKGLSSLDRTSFPQAAKELKQAAQAGAHDALTSFVLGLCAQYTVARGQKPDWELSRKYLDQALACYDATPGQDLLTQALTHQYLAHCYRDRQETTATLAQLEKAYSLDRNNPDIIDDVVRAYVDASAHDKALKTLDVFLAVYPQCETFVTLRVDALHKMALYDEYLKALEQRAKAFPQVPGYQREYLKEMEKREDWAGCMKYLESALAQLPKDQDKRGAWYIESEICRYAIKADKPKQAIKYAEDLAKTRGGAEDFANLGRSYTSAGQWGKAAEAFHKFEEEVGKGDPQRTDFARRRISKELDTVLPHLNKTQLIQYGYKERADQLERVRQMRGTFYPWLVEHAGTMKTLLLAVGIIGLALLLLFKFLGRSSV